jgi:glutaredoxin
MGKQNSGHGHVFTRPDGLRMRCGGPSMCDECAKDLATLESRKQDIATATANLTEAAQALSDNSTETDDVSTDDYGEMIRKRWDAFRTALAEYRKAVDGE